MQPPKIRNIRGGQTKPGPHRRITVRPQQGQPKLGPMGGTLSDHRNIRCTRQRQLGPHGRGPMKPSEKKRHTGATQAGTPWAGPCATTGNPPRRGNPSPDPMGGTVCDRKMRHMRATQSGASWAGPCPTTTQPATQMATPVEIPWAVLYPSTGDPSHKGNTRWDPMGGTLCKRKNTATQGQPKPGPHGRNPVQPPDIRHTRQPKPEPHGRDPMQPPGIRRNSSLDPMGATLCNRRRS